MSADLEPFKKLKWFYAEGNLDEAFNCFNNFDLTNYGFTTIGIRWAMKHSFQMPNEQGTMITMYPIEDLDLFNEKMGWAISVNNPRVRILSWDEVSAIHEDLLEKARIRAEEMAKIPTPEDEYKAQQLLLLAKINNKLDALNNK